MSVSRPPNVVVVLLDSLNRHMLGATGQRVRDAEPGPAAPGRLVRFDRHFTAPCPACRPGTTSCAGRSISSGAVGVGGALGGRHHRPARAAGVTTKLITDHPHLFEAGGENYHVDFTAWDYQRGHEGDAWKTRPDPSWAGAPAFGRGHMPYDNSRGWFRGEADFPGPRTMAAAARWLDDDAPGRGARALLPVRGRVRSPRAVRHARALGLDIRSATGRART